MTESQRNVSIFNHSKQITTQLHILWFCCRHLMVLTDMGTGRSLIAYSSGLSRGMEIISDGCKFPSQEKHCNKHSVQPELKHHQRELTN